MNAHVLRHFDVITKTSEEMFYDLFSSLLSDNRLGIKMLDKRTIGKIRSLIVTDRRTIKDLMNLKDEKVIKLCNNADAQSILIVLDRIRAHYYSNQIIRISELG